MRIFISNIKIVIAHSLECTDYSHVFASNGKEAIEQRLLTGKFDGVSDAVAKKMREAKFNGGCKNFTWDEYRHWLALLMKNKNYPKYGIKQNFLQLTVVC